MIEIGRRVGVVYEGRLEDGAVFDSTSLHGGKPLEFVLGQGQVIAGLERAVADMSAHEKRTVTVPAREAYGERDERLVERIPLSAFPNAEKLSTGQYIVVSLPGEKRRVKVESVSDGYIVLDSNHELAGHDLTFDIEVVSILGETGTLVENERHAAGCTCGCHRFKEQVERG